MICKVGYLPRHRRAATFWPAWYMVAICCALAPPTLGSEACPDPRAVELYTRAQSSLGDRQELASIIRAATRPMDHPAKIHACRALASASETFEQTLERKRNDLHTWPPRRPEVDEQALAEQHAALDSCPHYALPLASPLPIRRAVRRLPEDVIRDGITGWVDVEAEIDTQGRVIRTEVIASSDARLDAAAQAHVELSLYHPQSIHGFDDDTMRVRDRVITHAMDIARARGCFIEATEQPEP